MDQNNIDHLIRDALYDHKKSIDKDLLWAAIENKRRRTPFRLSLLIGVIALVLIGLVSWPYLTHRADTPSITENKRISTSSNNNQEEEKNNNLLTGQIEETTIKQSNNTIQNQKETAQKATYAQEASSLKTNLNSNSTKNNSIQENTNTPASNTNNVIQSNAKIVSTGNASTKGSIPVDLKEASEDQTELSNIAALEQLMILDKKSNDLAFQRPTFLNNDRVKCYEHGKKPKQLFIESYALIDLVSKDMDSKEDDLNYLNKRKETQTQLEGYRAGLRFKYLFANGFYIKSGLEAGMIRERFDKEETNETIKILPNQLLETITQNDTTIYIYGDSPVTVIETNTWKIWNTYRSIGIPVLAGFQFEGNKLSYSLELGALYNLFYDFEGYLLDPTTLTPIEASTYFKNRINTSITGGVAVGYQLNSKYKLNFMASFKKNMQSINSIENLINQSNLRYGIGLGLEFKVF